MNGARKTLLRRNRFRCFTGFRIRIHLIRIRIWIQSGSRIQSGFGTRIQSWSRFRFQSGSRVFFQSFDDKKCQKFIAGNFFIFFLLKTTIYLHKGRPSYKRSLQLSKENIQYIKTRSFLIFFYFCGSFLHSWIRIRILITDTDLPDLNESGSNTDPDPSHWLNPDPKPWYFQLNKSCWQIGREQDRSWSFYLYELWDNWKQIYYNVFRSTKVGTGWTAQWVNKVFCLLIKLLPEGTDNCFCMLAADLPVWVYFLVGHCTQRYQVLTIQITGT